MAPGCWKLATEVFAREYSDPAYMDVHCLTVDAYAAQHHLAHTEPRIIQSLNVHLLRLYLMLEKNMSPKGAGNIMERAIKKYKYQFKWLKPPASRGSITIIDVHKAKNPQEHAKIVTQWAQDVLHAWKEHHREIIKLYENIV